MSIHEQIATLIVRVNELYEMVGSLQQWQSLIVENWMRRVEERFDILNENISSKVSEDFNPKILNEIPTLFNNMQHALEMIDNLSKRLTHLEKENQQAKQATVQLLKMIFSSKNFNEAIEKIENPQVFDLEKVIEKIDKDLHPDSEEPEHE